MEAIIGEDDDDLGLKEEDHPDPLMMDDDNPYDVEAHPLHGEDLDGEF